ncbi:MAG: competence/damage-inducible protein A [Proteobacteria bacterium]|nr:competence/damage-inducible protein A [Pseudomonadota bacterium]
MKSQVLHSNRIAIVAVGTELTTGDVLNKNASWLSANLVDLGYSISMHLTVPDDRELMEQSLKFAMNHADFMFVTGGLGPTSDDFTRDVLAKILQRKLVWNEEAWNNTKNRLLSLNVEISESNRQQCFFPEGATVLKNPNGTAAGFYSNLGSCVIIALPGPPNEIAAIWCSSLNDILSENVPSSQRTQLYKLTCLGLSESRLGEIVEQHLKDSNFLLGYRARVPYVDIKIWYPPNRKEELDSKWIPRLKSSLSTWVIGENDYDVAKELSTELSNLNQPIYILDTVTDGSIYQRLLGGNDKGINLNIAISNKRIPSSQTPGIQLTVDGDFMTGDWSVALVINEKTIQYSSTCRYKGAEHRERFKTLVCESSLIEVHKQLRQLITQ